jgi:3',5'-cyclic AMP phosphodiesterase CpdA
MLRVVHLSDIHHQLDWTQRSAISSGWRGALGRFELQGLGRLARFHGVADRIAGLVDQVQALEVDQVLITGDFTALGDPDELTQVRALLAPLISTAKLTVIPGNHDRYTSPVSAGRFEQCFGDLLVSDLPGHADAAGFPFVKLIGAHFAIVGLDSTRVSGMGQYFFGRLGADQRARLGRVLDDPQLAGRTVLVLCHHGPLGPSGSFDWREAGLADSGQLLALLRDRPVVLHHGHSHHRFWHPAKDGAPHIFGGGSSTEPGTEGFWLIELDDHQRLEARPIAARVQAPGALRPASRPDSATDGEAWARKS